MNGKGMTRVQIARSVVEKAKIKLDEANARLNRAIQDEASRADKRKAQEKRTRDRAITVLVKAGMSPKKAEAVLNGKI